jgi:hypothetical protein
MGHSRGIKRTQFGAQAKFPTVIRTLVIRTKIVWIMRYWTGQPSLVRSDSPGAIEHGAKRQLLDPRTVIPFLSEWS